MVDQNSPKSFRLLSPSRPAMALCCSSNRCVFQAIGMVHCGFRHFLLHILVSYLAHSAQSCFEGGTCSLFSTFPANNFATAFGAVLTWSRTQDVERNQTVAEDVDDCRPLLRTWLCGSDHSYLSAEYLEIFAMAHAAWINYLFNWSLYCCLDLTTLINWKKGILAYWLDLRLEKKLKGAKYGWQIHEK